MIFGGTSFMGLGLLKYIASIEQMTQQVLIVNRGNVHWDNESASVMAKRPDRFIQVKADRDEESFS